MYEQNGKTCGDWMLVPDDGGGSNNRYISTGVASAGSAADEHE